MKIFNLLIPSVVIFIICGANCVSKDQLYFREDFKEIPAAIPITQEHIEHPDLRLHRHGQAADSIKKSHHDNIPNDPYYVWSGLCTTGHWAISFSKRNQTVDLTDGKIRIRTKQYGCHILRIILKTHTGDWLVSDHGFGETPDWHIFEPELKIFKWHQLDIDQIIAGELIESPDLSHIQAIGWSDLTVGEGSKGCTRVDWIEVYGTIK